MLSLSTVVVRHFFRHQSVLLVSVDVRAKTLSSVTVIWKNSRSYEIEFFQKLHVPPFVRVMNMDLITLGVVKVAS